MKQTFRFFAAIWAICLALFNVVVFVTPNEVAGMNKFGDAFWVGYIFITIAFLGQLVCAFFAFKPDRNQEVLYNIPLVTISYTGLIVMLIVGTACMIIPNVPNWIGIIACIVVLAVTAIAILKASYAASVVSDIDERVKTRTAFIKMLSVDAEQLMNTARSAELKSFAKKVYEAVRYSDPMSNVALVEVEEKIQKGYAAFENAVNTEDLELAAASADELIALIDIRNKKCKLLK